MSPEPVTPPETFAQWVRGLHKRALAYVAAGTVVVSAASQVMAAAKKAPDWLLPYAPAVAHFLQAAVILILLVILAGDYRNSGERRAAEAVRQFLKHWRAVWLAWLVLYLFMGIEDFTHIGQAAPHSKEWEVTSRLITNFLNNVQSALFLLCWYVLSEPSLEESGEGYATTVPYTLVFGLLMGYTAAEVLICVKVTAVWVPLIFKLVSGIGAGVAMAMFFGRLESKLVNASPWITIPLYCYALIQPLFVVLGLDKFQVEPWLASFFGVVAQVVVLCALLLKVLLFLFVYWLIHKNRLLFYMVNVHERQVMVHKQWADFVRDPGRVDRLVDDLKVTYATDQLKVPEWKKALERIVEAKDEVNHLERKCRHTMESVLAQGGSAREHELLTLAQQLKDAVEKLHECQADLVGLLDVRHQVKMVRSGVLKSQQVHGLVVLGGGR